MSGPREGDAGGAGAGESGFDRAVREAVIVVTRIARTLEAYNAVNVPTVRVYVQRFPGRPERDNRGVQDLEFHVECDGVRVRQGRTPATGRIDVRLPAGRGVTLNVLGSQYEITRLASLHPRGQIRGVQQRVGLLGYHPGALHGNADLANAFVNPDEDTERAMLDFQADSDLFPDAQFGTNSDGALRRVMQQSRAE